MKKFVPILAVVLLKMISNGGSMEFTSFSVTQIATDNETHSSPIYETIPAAARLVTAITLQNGLSDGSIKADDVIVDLLNVGSVSLVELEKNFTSESGNSLFKSVTYSQNAYEYKEHNLKFIEKIEKSFIEMHKIVEKWNILKLELKEVPTKLNFTTLDEVKNWNNVSMFQNVKIRGILLEDFIRGSNSDYGSLKDRLKAFVDFEPSTTNQYKNVRSFLLSLIPFCEFFDLMRQLDKIEKLTSHVSSMNGILDRFNNMIDDQVSLSLTIANNMLSWHSGRSPRTAPGFVNGYMDLKKLENDTGYSWINDAIVSIEGVHSFAQLEPTMEKFGNFMNAVSTPENRRTINKFNALKASIVSTTDVKETLQKVRDCPAIKDIRRTPIERAISSLSLHIRMLLNLIDARETVSILITEKHRAIITNISAKTKKEDLRELAEIVKLLNKPIEVIKRGKSEYSAAQIQLNEDYLTTFNDYNYVQSFIKRLECFVAISEPIKKVSSTFLATSTFRLIMKSRKDRNYGKQINDIFMAIGNSRELISPLREVVKTIKEDESVNVLNLRNLSGLEPYTKPLAEAATVLVMIKRAKELRKELALFVADGLFVHSAIGGHTDEILKEELLQYWGDFDNTILEIFNFFAYIYAWEEKLGNSSSSEITEYGNSLKELATVPSVEFNVQRRTIAVEKFQKVIDDKNVKSALERLDGCLWKFSKLDLQFAGYRKSLEQMPDILAAVHKVFHEPAVNHDSRQAERTTKEEKGSDMMIYLYILLGVFAIIIIVGAIWWFLTSATAAPPKKALHRSKKESIHDESSQSYK